MPHFSSYWNNWVFLSGLIAKSLEPLKSPFQFFDNYDKEIISNDIILINEVLEFLNQKKITGKDKWTIHYTRNSCEIKKNNDGKEKKIFFKSKIENTYKIFLFIEAKKKGELSLISERDFYQIKKDLLEKEILYLRENKQIKERTLFWEFLESYISLRIATYKDVDYYGCSEEVITHKNILKFIEGKIKLYGKNYDTNIIQRTFNFKSDKIECLNYLHNFLIEGKFIHVISFENFKIIFNNEPRENIKEKIKWINLGKKTRESNCETIYELLYFLKKLNLLDNDNFITVKDKNSIQEKIGFCFVDMNDEEFDNIRGKNPLSKYSETPKYPKYHIDHYDYPEEFQDLKHELFSSNNS